MPLMSVSCGLSSIWISPMTNFTPRSATSVRDSLPEISSMVATDVVWGSASETIPVLRMTSVPTAATSSDEMSVIPAPVTVMLLAVRRAGKASTSACVDSV